MRGTCASVSGIAAKAPETSVHQHSLCPELLALKPAQTRDLHADAAIHKHMNDKGHKQAPQEIFCCSATGPVRAHKKLSKLD